MILLNSKQISFPDPALYDGHDGIIAIGGDLSPERVLFAYENGIFPWYNPGEDILWWCPDPRFVLFPDEIKISKSMKKILDRNIFSFTENQNFHEVLLHCQKSPRKGQDGTWLSDELIAVFLQLHQANIAHSVEVWHNKQLVGGFYGLKIGNIFCGESMFTKVSNASKAGFLHFVQKYAQTFSVIDCQWHSNHLESLGARMIPKREFLNLLHL